MNWHLNSILCSIRDRPIVISDISSSEGEHSFNQFFIDGQVFHQNPGGNS